MRSELPIAVPTAPAIQGLAGDGTGASQLSARSAAGGSQVRGGRYFFSRMFSVALLVAAPLLALHAWTLYRQLHSAEQKAYQELRTQSLRAAKSVETTLDGAERLLKFLVVHPEILSLVPARCTEFLRGLEGVNAVQAVVSVLDHTGQARCISVPVAAPPASAGNSAWFKQALASDEFFLGKPAIGRITGLPVAPLSLALKDAGGTTIAIVVVSIHLLQLEGQMVETWPHSKGILALVNQDHQFLVRSPDTPKWMGRSASAPVMALRAQMPGAITQAKGVDGIERVYSSASVAKHQLRVYASLPANEVFGQSQAEIRNAIAYAVTALLLAAIVAWHGARTLARPLHSLAKTAGALAEGLPSVRADESLPGEFQRLAVNMNRMLDAREHSELRARRMARFYEALSRTNQAIVRTNEPADLYTAICEVCVETGHASMAWVGLIEGRRLTPVAWGGPARQYTQGLNIDLASQDSEVKGPSGAQILLGQCSVTNDYVNDPRTVGLRRNAEPFEVRACAALPFSQGGQVVGTLNLYAREAGFFDDELMRLLVTLAADLSFALDNFERSAAHRRTALELAKRESQLSGIVESALDAIITIDSRHRILVFNHAASRLFGLPASEAIGEHWGRFLPPHHRASLVPDIETYARRPAEDAGMSAPRQLLGLRSDGVEFPMELSAFSSYEGSESLLTMTMRDVTGERDAERARVSAIESEAANRAKTDFLSRMSHELRTPLNAVLGFSQLLQEGARPKLSETERHQLDLLQLGSEQLRALVDDVLDVSAIEAGKLSMALHDCELTGLVDGAMRMSEAAAKLGDVRLVPVYISTTPVMVHADPIRLRQVVLNLLSNGIKYNRAGGTVRVGIEQLSGRVRIWVTDTGMGMSAQQLKCLFEPFNRLGRENSTIAGTGIGLALVKQLVVLMGGTIDVQSSQGTGTTVQVEFVALHIDAAPRLLATEIARQDAPVLPVAGPSGQVLYIEDNPVNVLVVQSILRRWPGVRLVVAEDGRTGLEQAKLLRPDVVLLDMRLPDMTGVAVLKQLRRDPATQGLYAVALSASAMPHEISEAMAAGAQDYWTKPIHVLSFCENMAALLRSRDPVSGNRSIA